MNGRSILAVLAGIVGGMVIIMIIQSILHEIYPIDIKKLMELYKEDPEGYREFLRNQPIGAHLGVILSHGLGAFGGMIIGRLIDRKNGMTVIAIALILLLGNVVNFISMPHPLWFPFVDILFTLGIAIAFIFTRKKA
ncbi:hypothetical protein N9089_00580 [Crocinitomicaceae bacterium]|nr:hypothetical protein [Crocinitomicaceae bacterium]